MDVDEILWDKLKAACVDGVFAVMVPYHSV